MGLVAGCASPQYRAMQAMVGAPLVPAPRYDALGSAQPLTPSVEQWAVYEEQGPQGRVLLTAVLQDGPHGWRVELNRRSRRHTQQDTVPLTSHDDPFLSMRRGAGAMRLKTAVDIPAGRFIGAVQHKGALYHPRVPILGLLQGVSKQGVRWRLLRFGLDQPPTMR